MNRSHTTVRMRGHHRFHIGLVLLLMVSTTLVPLQRATHVSATAITTGTLDDNEASTRAEAVVVNPETPIEARFVPAPVRGISLGSPTGRLSSFQLTATITQITGTTGGFIPSGDISINADGTRIVFASSRNLTGGNADNNFEIFLFDTSIGTLTQITTTTTGGNGGPSINADGTRIAFHFGRQAGGGADSNFEIFLFDTTTSTFTQITNTSGGDNFLPSINADGTRIAFHSDSNLTGGNADGSVEIILFDTTVNGLTQVTNTREDSTSPSINADGTRIAFESDADLVSGGNTDGNIEIFLFETTTGTFTQVTNTNDPTDMRAPSINADGTRIAFHSEGIGEVFLFDTTTNGLTQITNNSERSSRDPSINADGTRIAFESDADLVSGGNTDGNTEIFLFDTTTGTFTQITSIHTVGDEVNNSASPVSNSDGTRIAFASEADLTGGNADGNEEIFLWVQAGTPPPTRPITTTFGPPSPSNPSGTFAEPVNTATGNYFFQRTDLAIPGRGLPVVFTRTYNSQDTYSGPFGHGWTHSYNILLTENSDGTVVVKQGDGHEEFYDPTGGGNYKSRFAGLFNILVKNPDGSFTLTLRDQTQHQFSAGGKLTHITDRNGNALSFSYDGEGNLTSITDTVGRTIILSYDTSNRITQLTDPIQRIVKYSYDAEGNLDSHTDPKGGVMRYSYDAAHRVRQIKNQRGILLVENEYDTDGRVFLQRNGRRLVTSFAYDVPRPGDTRITDPRGHITIHTHDAQLRLIGVTDPLGNTVAMTYDVNGNRDSISDKNGNTTRFTYDDRGNLTSVIAPLGNRITFTYDANNNLTSVKDARGFTTTFNYDAKVNLSSIQDALGRITTFAYNRFGQVTKTIDARGNLTRYDYDAQGNVMEITDALKGKTKNDYDGIGRLIHLTDPNGHVGTAGYDANSRLTQVKNHLGHVTDFEYDPVGNLVKITDPRRKVTRYDYDQVNNLMTVTDALGHITRYTYDFNNNRETLKDANGHTRTYGFDALNRLTSIKDPLGNKTTYSYDPAGNDPAGNVVVVKDANGKTTTFTYDANNLLKKIAYEDGSSVTYSYDANGNRDSTEDHRGTTTYIYDALDQLTEVIHPGGSVVKYGYDAIGNQKSLNYTSPNYPDGRGISYRYDKLNRLTRVTDWAKRKTHYAYDPASNLRQIRYPNHTSISYDYDEADRLVTVENKRNEVTLARFTYTPDELGNRIEMVAEGQGKPDVVFSYEYDALSQLEVVRESRRGRTIRSTEYSYDPVGNRRSLAAFLGDASEEVAPTEFIHYTYDADDRLLQAGHTTFTYDANGNRLTEATPGGRNSAYAYDDANRLIRVTKDGTQVAYTYDGDGNKVEQTINEVDDPAKPGHTEIVRFLNDIASPLTVVLAQDRIEDGRQKETTHYLYGLGLISEELLRLGPHPKSETFFYHSDELESTVALTDSSGRAQARYRYDAWGNLESSRGNVPNRFLFTGEEQDPVTGLYYLRARWYDPTVGRFLTKDPFGGVAAFPQSLNGYVYALNSPTNLLDPTGEFSIKSALKKGLKRLKTAAQSDLGRALIRAGIEFGGTALLSTFLPPPLAGFVAGAAAEFTDRLISGRPLTLKHVLLQDVLVGGAIGASNAFFTDVVTGGKYVWQLNRNEFVRWAAVKTFYGGFLPRPQGIVPLGGEQPQFPAVSNWFPLSATATSPQGGK